jgi:hypothetical protein
LQVFNRDSLIQGDAYQRIIDITEIDLRRQGFPAQPRPLAVRAGTHGHILLDFIPHIGRVGFVVALLQVGDNAGKRPGFMNAPAAVIIKEFNGLTLRPQKKGLLDLV